MITNPKDFFQQIQNLCEELGLKMKAISESIAGFISKSDAESTYLKKTDAQSTYLGKTAKAESAKTADTATSATSATKATQDGNGAVISSTYLKSATASSTYLTKSDAQATYLGKDAKAQSATFADSATTATSANSALKATQDGDGNVISGTYLKNANAESTYLTKANASSTYLSKSDASSTYLGKTAKAASATTADSATKATQDGNGANIALTYIKTINNVAPVNGNVAIPVPEIDTSALVVKNGNRGQLAGYETPSVTASAVTINQGSADTTQVTGAVAVTVEPGAEGTSWTKTVSLVNASATITLGDSWVWSGGEAPTVSENAVLVLHWCNDVGVASLADGAEYLRTYTGTITYSAKLGQSAQISRNGVVIYQLASGTTTQCTLAVGDYFSGSIVPTVTSSSGFAISNFSEIGYLESGFTAELYYGGDYSGGAN